MNAGTGKLYGLKTEPEINGAAAATGAWRRASAGDAKTAAGAGAATATGVAMAWFTVCALYDDAYGTIPPNATEAMADKMTKI